MATPKRTSVSAKSRRSSFAARLLGVSPDKGAGRKKPKFVDGKPKVSANSKPYKRTGMTLSELRASKKKTAKSGNGGGNPYRDKKSGKFTSKK